MPSLVLLGIISQFIHQRDMFSQLPRLTFTFSSTLPPLYLPPSPQPKSPLHEWTTCTFHFFILGLVCSATIAALSMILLFFYYLFICVPVSKKRIPFHFLLFFSAQLLFDGQMDGWRLERRFISSNLNICWQISSVISFIIPHSLALYP